MLIALGFFSLVLTPGFVLLPALTVSPSTVVILEETRRSPRGYTGSGQTDLEKFQGPIVTTTDLITAG